MVKPNPYLLGRYLDPLFAICVGTVSYFSYERKAGREEGHSLKQLLSKRFERIRAGKQSGHI
ncbi:LANO_0G03180g1_1 [Lachancea nothofagi CBS 11611]|uniref:LANO_0G03180g1_1 n=1 Tax=Lachancea nothofagi CBS 11611 TaxID=1266666 RepID=A0A1G4KFE2_9SACH|nr:LANO_0G03180g1_1 [Lachancea nothofagi CBS 11611]